MASPIVRNFDKLTHKKCITCRDVHLKETHFGQHDDTWDGYQVICKICKGDMNKRNRNRNVSQYLRHHIATRCLTQLGEFAPEEFTKNLEKHLGYKITALVKHLRQDLQEREGPKRKLRDALNEGYHIDHIHPLSKFMVIKPQVSKDEVVGEEVDWEVFKECWAMTNLRAIPAAENLAKGATVDNSAQQSSKELSQKLSKELSQESYRGTTGAVHDGKIP